MRDKFYYFPESGSKKIRTLLLDANITAALDSIYQGGLGFREEAIRIRMGDLLRRLDEEVEVLPGLGAAESVMRKDNGFFLPHNYDRRCANATRLFEDERRGIRAWVEKDGGKFEKFLQASAIPAPLDKSKEFGVVYENIIVPSYVLLLKVYQIYLQNADQEQTIRSLHELEGFDAELHGRGSVELLLGALLLAGNTRGRELVLNLFKLKQPKSYVETLNCIWNACFDLTYSRQAQNQTAPENKLLVGEPVAFVSDDRHLGNFLEIISPLGYVQSPAGGGFTGGSANIHKMISPHLANEVAQVINRSSADGLADKTPAKLLSGIRKYRSKVYRGQLEEWFERTLR